MKIPWPLKMDSLKQTLTLYLNETVQKYQLETSIIRSIDRSRLEVRFEPLFKPIRPLEAELWPWFDLRRRYWSLLGRWTFSVFSGDR